MGHCSEVSWCRWRRHPLFYGHGPLPSDELGQMKKTFIFLWSWAIALRWVGVCEEYVCFPLVTGHCPQVSWCRWRRHPFSVAFGHGPLPWGEFIQVKNTSVSLWSWAIALRWVGVDEEDIHFPLVTGHCPEVSLPRWSRQPIFFWSRATALKWVGLGEEGIYFFLWSQATVHPSEDYIHFTLVMGHCPEVSWCMWRRHPFSFGHGPLPWGELVYVKKTSIFLWSRATAMRWV